MYSEQKSQEYQSDLSRLVEQIDQVMPRSGNPKLAFCTLRTVLWAIRDQLSFESAIQFLQRLPLPLKAVYLDHWDIYADKSEKPVTKVGSVESKQSIPDLLGQLRGDRELTNEHLNAILKIIASTMASPITEYASAIRANDLQKSVEKSLSQENDDDIPDSSIWLS